MNGAFRDQRITGQQRFATELIDAVLRAAPAAGLTITERRPPRWAVGSRALVWLWLQTLAITPRGAVLLSLTSRAPLLARNHVVVVHDTFVLRHPEWYRPLYRWTHAVLLRRQLRTARALVAVSEPVADELRRERDVEVTVVPNAPGPVFVDEAPPVPAGRAAAAGGFLLAVGSLEPRKNLGALLTAYAGLPDAFRSAHPLLIAGDVGAAFASPHLPPVPAGAELIGYVPDDVLADLYRRALAVVFVSLDEGFGLPAVEALACGARLIASDIPVLRWVCGDLADHVDPTSPEAIAAALRRAAAAEESAAERRARSRSIGARFSWTDSAARLIGRLTTVAGDRRT